MVKREKTHNKIAKRRKTKKKWPGEKGQTIKRQSDIKMDFFVDFVLLFYCLSFFFSPF
jgi:ribosomal protein S25